MSLHFPFMSLCQITKAANALFAVLNDARTHEPAQNHTVYVMRSCGKQVASFFSLLEMVASSLMRRNIYWEIRSGQLASSLTLVIGLAQISTTTWRDNVCQRVASTLSPISLYRRRVISGVAVTIWFRELELDPHTRVQKVSRCLNPSYCAASTSLAPSTGAYDDVRTV